MRHLIYILVIGILASCTSNTIMKKPENLIPKDVMTNILTDLYIANGAENIKNMHNQRGVDYYYLVYEKYNIDSVRFKESNLYYTSTIDEYNLMLQEVYQRVEKQFNELNTQLRISDSLRSDSIRKKYPKVINERPID